MTLPDPKPGLVIGYSYLWRHENEAGKSEGRKDRPCAIVAAVEDEDGEKIVIVLPVTHSRPKDLQAALEIPHITKQRLGLDSERSWIICSEANKFIWPGPDLRPVSRTKKDIFEYGFLPQKLLTAIEARMRFLREGRRLKIVPRDE